jgi:endonuclease/exonuclease/phosphatase family metal-dependent hydrolase
MGRSICGLTLDGPFGSLDVFTTHLAFPIDAGADRERQARACRSFIHQINPDFRKRPIIFGGDFNDEPDSATVGLFLADGVFVDSMAGVPVEERITFAWENPYTDAALHPGRCIDYVLHNSLLATVESRVAGAAVDGRLAPSDHYGVLARLCPK